MPSRFTRAVVPFIAVLSLAFVGCKPKAGGKCAGSSTCANPTNGLICVNGTYQAVACRGPKGCAASAGQVTCDNSFATEGDGCTEKGDPACTVDKKNAVECDGTKFVLAETCKGARGCGVNDDKISCDNDVADKDDPCHFDGDYACTSDKLHVLRCVDHKMTELNSCKGPNACRIFELPQEKKIDFVCDDTIADVDDVCDEDKEEACSTDKKSLLHCRQLKFALLRPCPGGCSFDERAKHFSCAGGGGGGTGAGAGGGANAKGDAGAPSAKPAGKAAPAASTKKK